MVSITEKTVTSYTIHAGGGDYGIVVLDLGERSVSVLAESSYGTYGHRWSNVGVLPIEFLCKVSFESAMSKFRGRDYEVFDAQKQQVELIERIGALRSSDVITEEQALSLRDDVSDICTERTVSEFKMSTHHCSDLFKLVYNDEADNIHPRLKYDSACVQFWELIWMPLVAHLRKRHHAGMVTQ